MFMTHLATKKIYKYIIKVKDTPNLRFGEHGWNIECNVFKKYNKTKIFLSLGCLQTL